jgi:hypothetical protein
MSENSNHQEMKKVVQFYCVATGEPEYCYKFREMDWDALPLEVKEALPVVYRHMQDNRWVKLLLGNYERHPQSIKIIPDKQKIDEIARLADEHLPDSQEKTNVLEILRLLSVRVNDVPN